MSKLLEKYEDFLSELDKSLSPLADVVEKENFSQEECHTVANFCTAAITIQKEEEHYKNCIEAIGEALKYFNLEEGK